MTTVELRLPPLHAAQQEIWDSPARFKVVCAGRRLGKTHFAVLWCIVRAVGGKRGWWIAPAYKTANIGWRIAKHLARAIPGAKVREAERTIEFASGGVLGIQTSERPDLLRGEGLDFVVFDEVADIKAEVWEDVIRPQLLDNDGEAVFIGTPRGQDNWFYDLWLLAQSPEGVAQGWVTFRFPTYANPLMTPDKIEALALGWSDIKRAQEIEAEFIVAGGTIFQDSWEKWYQLVGDQHVYMDTSSVVLLHEDHIYENVPLKRCIRFSTVDLAISTKTTADWTVIASWGLTPERRLVLLDFQRGRWEAPRILDELAKAKSRWRLAWHGIEKVAFQASLIQQARGRGMPCRELRPDKDKVARAYTAAAHMEGGRIWWRKTIVDMVTFRNEVMTFPLAKHDDCVDTVSYAASTVDKVHSGPQLVSWHHMPPHLTAGRMAACPLARRTSRFHSERGTAAFEPSPSSMSVTDI